MYRSHAKRLKAILDATNGVIAIGGKVDVDEKFMEPTVITGVDWSDVSMKVRVANNSNQNFGPDSATG
jgi:acyl-CoA reductase-like NAD-dependent aldehyde dehydrogenase